MNTRNLLSNKLKEPTDGFPRTILTQAQSACFYDKHYDKPCRNLSYAEASREGV